MFSLASPIDPTAQSLLACAQCARSKAKCDRKIPCTRCVGKKLKCQTRVSQRGAGQLFFDTTNNISNVPPTGINNNNINLDAMKSRSNDSSTTIIAAEATATAAAGRGGGIGDGDGDGSVASAHEQTTNGDDTPQDEAQVVAATSGAEETRLFPIDYQIDFTVPARIPAPMSQLATDQQKHSVNFPASPTIAARYDDNGNIPTAFPMERARTDVDPSRNLEGWPLFQCNPVIPSSACTPTAAQHVKNLPALLNGANNMASQSGSVNLQTVVEPLQARARETLIAVLQSLFNEAQQLHGLCDPGKGMSNWMGMTILVLPPPPQLKFLFRIFLDCYEQYYPFISTASMGINERMEDGGTILPSIFFLLTVAAGAKAAGLGETYSQIAYSLVEICSISLRGLFERNIKLASSLEVLECALLLIIVAVWNGDKWQMDTALYQKAMFSEMHLRAGIHDDRDAQVARLKSSNDIARSWEIWKEQERANRITYGWLILDHELCIFQDIPSTLFFTIGRLNTPIPNPDATWNVQSPMHWLRDTLPPPGQYSERVPPSLNQWKSRFSETNDISTMTHVSPTMLRLLLCHLHNLVIQFRVSIDEISSEYQTHRGLQHPRMALLSLQVQEFQELLNKWYNLTKTLGSNEASTAANLILYHLIMLNTMSSFPEIERLARTGRSDAPPRSSRSSFTDRPYHLENKREIFFHCGQVLRNIRSVQEPARPPWWAGAVYRAALISWANSMSSVDTDTHNEEAMETDETLLLDVLPADHPSITAYLGHRGGVPAFSGSNGVSVSLDDPIGILRYCAGFLDSDIKTSFTDGIRQKLQTMARRWETTNTLGRR